MKLTAVFASFAVLSASLLRQESGSSIDATIRGPAGLTFGARTDSVSVVDDGTTLTAKVNLSTLKTGIGLRDSHMSDALEVAKFPDAVLVVNDADLKIPATDDSVTSTAPAKLSLHGVTRDVTVKYYAAKDCEGHVGAKVNFTVNMTDYGITPPSHFGVSVKPEVPVEARVRLDTDK